MLKRRLKSRTGPLRQWARWSSTSAPGTYLRRLRSWMLIFCSCWQEDQLETLKLVCGEVLISKLEISNSISSFILVSRHFNVNTSVRKMMDMFMRCKAEKVVECDDWENITEGLPILAKDLVRVMVKGGGSEIHGCWFCNKNVNQMLFWRKYFYIWYKC